MPTMEENPQGKRPTRHIGYHSFSLVSGPWRKVSNQDFTLYTQAMNKEIRESSKRNIPCGTTPKKESQHALEELLRRMLEKDESALAELYDATAAKAYSLALRITQNPASAEEVLADLYLQAWQQAHRFNPNKGSPLGWLMMMCRSRALDTLRRQQPSQEDLEAHSHLLESTTQSPLDCLLAFDTHSQIYNLLATLEETERTLISLSFFRGFSHQEIAHYTGKPLGSVKSKLRNALLKLRNGIGNGTAVAGENP